MSNLVVKDSGVFVSLIKKNLTDRQKIEVAKGFRRLCRAVIDLALADLQYASVLSEEAAYFFESDLYLTLICQVAGVDPAEVYSAYKAIMESKDGVDVGKFATIAENGASDIDVFKDGKYVCTVPNITNAMSKVSLSYKSVLSLLSTGRTSRTGFQLRYRS